MRVNQRKDDLTEVGARPGPTQTRRDQTKKTKRGSAGGW